MLRTINLYDFNCRHLGLAYKKYTNARNIRAVISYLFIITHDTSVCIVRGSVAQQLSEVRILEGRVYQHALHIRAVQVSLPVYYSHQLAALDTCLRVHSTHVLYHCDTCSPYPNWVVQQISPSVVL